MENPRIRNAPSGLAHPRQGPCGHAGVRRQLWAVYEVTATGAETDTSFVHSVTKLEPPF